MISTDLFDRTETHMLHLANLWNIAEANSVLYDQLFVANPHELVALIGSATTYSDWQTFLTDSRVQDYIDRVIYTQAGIIINKYMSDSTRFNQADSARLSTAIKYRDDHRADFAIPVQYIYTQVPLTDEEKAFLNPDKKTTSI